MENASKALIIAGAILLSILIIGLGMYIYNQAANAMQNTGINELEVQRHNDPFLQYEGTQVAGSNVRALINKINANNRTNSTDESLQITIGGKKAGEDKDAFTPSKYLAGKTYKVEFKFDAQSGYVDDVTIELNK